MQFRYFASISQFSWWRHLMETLSASLTLCVGNSPVTGEFPAQRPVTRSFDVFFVLRLNKRLSKQSWSWWVETPSCSSWRHCNALPMSNQEYDRIGLNDDFVPNGQQFMMTHFYNGIAWLKTTHMPKFLLFNVGSCCCPANYGPLSSLEYWCNIRSKSLKRFLITHPTLLNKTRAPFLCAVYSVAKVSNQWGHIPYLFLGIDWEQDTYVVPMLSLNNSVYGNNCHKFKTVITTLLWWQTLILLPTIVRIHE